MTPDLVLVTWHDAHGSLTEYYAHKMHAPAVMHTVGWLMEANERVACRFAVSAARTDKSSTIADIRSSRLRWCCR
jgi:hypothetical protein